MIEKWKKIPYYIGYEVSDKGRIRSYRHKNGLRKKPFVLKPSIRRAEREVVTLYHESGRVQTFISRLVLFGFIGDCPKGMECRHLDGNVKNNCLSNLKWGTRQENEEDKRKHGTHRNQYTRLKRK